MRQRLTKLFLAASCAALVITKAGAADYAAGLAIDTEASHNDNIRMVPSDKTSVRKYDISPKLTFGINTETTKAQLDSTFNFNRYDKSEFNSDDQNIALALSHQFESSSVGLNASYIHNSTLTSELLTTGRVGTRADRSEQYMVSPNWTYTINEKNLVQLSGTYTTQNYENASYIGYKNTGAELDWTHSLGERTKLTVAATYSDYKTDDIKLGGVPSSGFQYITSDPTSPGVFAQILPGEYVGTIPANNFGEQSYAARTKNEGGQIGASYLITEQSQLSGYLGRSRNTNMYTIKDPKDVCSNADYTRLISEYSQGLLVPLRGSLSALCGSIPQTDAWLSTAQINWTWSSERQQLKLNGSKATQPTSNGYAVDALQLGSNWSYQLSELDKISASVSLVRNRAIDKKNTAQNITTQIADRNYGSATLQYQRQLSEYWFLNASFQFSEQKYTQIDYQASSRVYSLGISYKPQQWHWAR